MRGAALVIALAIACNSNQDKTPAQTPPSETPKSVVDAPMPPPTTDRLKVATDARIELFSILFGFAGAKHFGRGTQAAYMDAMGKHFKPFAHHPAVIASTELRSKHGISFEAPMKLAIYLDQDLAPIRPLSPLPPGLERWKDVDIDAYLAKVRAFAAETGFAEFFASQHQARLSVEDRFRAFVADKGILAWYDAVFGRRPNASYQIIPAFVVGGMNYGISAIHTDGREEIVMVMYLENPTGKAFEPGDPTLGVLVHEVGHSYINHVFDARWKEIEPVFAPLFARVEPAMRAQSYSTPPYALNEAVVRAVTLLYLREKSSADHAARDLAEQNKLQFVWAGPIADALAARRTKDGGTLSAEALFDTVKTALERSAAKPAP